MYAVHTRPASCSDILLMLYNLKLENQEFLDGMVGDTY
nr:MAG TPA: hypothetical protein [Caudoviricetes sp.]